MKKHSVSVGCFAALFALALLLSGCGDGAGDGDGDKPPPVPETNAPVYTWQHQGGGAYTGDLTVKIAVYDGDFGYLDAGAISAGKLTLDLPSLDAKYSSALKAGHFNKEGITVSPEDANYHIADFYVFAGKEEAAVEKGSLGYFKETSDAAVEDEVLYYYLDKDASVTGTYIDYDDTTYSYSITGKAGWNRIWKHPSPDGTTETETETTDLSDIPDGMKWIVDLYE
jgi:hypothetical protein